MLKVDRKKNQSFESLMRQFRNTMKLSGQMKQARKVQYFDRKKSKNKQKASKLVQLEKTARITQALKTGKITEQDLRSRKFKLPK